MEATTKDLRLHTRELLSATDRGEEVIITYRGKRRVKLIAWSDEQERVTRPSQRNPAFNLWASHSDEQSVDEQVRTLRQPRNLT